jgi:hypothetical protein
MDPNEQVIRALESQGARVTALTVDSEGTIWEVRFPHKTHAAAETMHAASTALDAILGHPCGSATGPVVYGFVVHAGCARYEARVAVTAGERDWPQEVVCVMDACLWRTQQQALRALSS